MTRLQQHFDRVAAERRVQELEGRIHRLTVARWSMPQIAAGADSELLVREFARRSGVGERLRRREERIRSELAKRIAANRVVRAQRRERGRA